MEFPKNALILGCSSIPLALIQVLELFGTKCYHDSIPLEEKPPNLDECDLVIAVVSNYTEVIPLIHRLRTDLDWTGKFIAIVPNSTQIESLNKQGIFGDNNGILYQGILGQGHITISLIQDDLLTNLVDLIIDEQKLKPVYSSGWQKLLQTWKLPQTVKTILESNQNSDLTEITNQLENAMNEFKNGSWGLWLEHHDKSANILINEYANLSITTINDCQNIAQKIKDIFIKANLGGLFE